MRQRLSNLVGAGFRDFPVDNAGQCLAFLLHRHDKDQSGKRDLFARAVEIEASDVYMAAYTDWKAFVTNSGWACTEASLIHRMFIGLGEASVLETHVALHRVYGVPYLPGSSLKGLTSHYAKALQDQGSDFLTCEQQKWLFGALDATSAGHLDFQDGWWVPVPDGKPLCLEVDTPHHMRYHATRGETPATDRDDPNPVSHLAVQGRFLLSIAGAGDPMAARLALAILTRGLATWGLGGRVSVDYGLFESTNQDAAREGCQ